MERNKETRKKPGNVGFDESLIDPRLRSDTAETRAALGTASAPAFGPAPLLDEIHTRIREEVADENMNLPESAYKSLDFAMTSPNLRDEIERFWLIGLQTGIGLGIAGAREAVLNEMQWENTVFQRPIQSQPSDPDPYQIRMAIGQACVTGFDRRVAYRVANHFLGACSELADMIVENGLTSCLPETGHALMGTSLLFTAEKVARCHYNARRLKQLREFSAAYPHPSLPTGNSFGAEQPVPHTASFTTDGTTVGGIDMTQLNGAAALVANTLRATYGIGGPGMPNQLYQSREPQPMPHVPRRAQGARLSAHVTNDYQGPQTRYGHVDTDNMTLNVRPGVGHRPKRAPTQYITAAAQATSSRGVKKAGRGFYRGSASPANGKGPTESRSASSQRRPLLLETRSGRAVVQSLKQT